MTNLSPIQFPDVTSLDDLIERAKRGVVATTAIDLIKDELTSLKNKRYLELLNETDREKMIERKCELKAIEWLAKALLVKEAQGKQAYEMLIGVSGKSEAEIPMLTPRTASRTRRQRAAGPIVK